MYATIEEANLYIETRYSIAGLNPEMWEKWDDLEPESKTALLEMAGLAINRLPFTGRVSVIGQPLPFPRYPETEVSNEVKYAQIEEALAYCDPVYVESRASYEDLMARGVLRYGIGNFSERFANNFKGSTGLSYKASAYLRKYMTGGYAIC